MTVQPHPSSRLSHVVGCTGFWLWAVVGAGVVFGFISFVGFVTLLPAAGLAFWLARRSRWNSGPVMIGLLSGAGLPLLLVAALNWSDWHQRISGDNTPNPYDWGGVGLLLVVAGVVAFAALHSRSD